MKDGNFENSILFIGRLYVSDVSSLLMNILSFGIFYVLCKLSTKCEIYLKTSPCLLDEANCIIIKDQYGSVQIYRVNHLKVKPTLTLKRYTKDKIVKIVKTPFGRFIYDYSLQKFVLPSYIQSKKNLEQIFSERLHRSKEEELNDIYEKTVIYGKNDSGVVVLSTLDILIDNIIEPFFLWELFSFVTWIAINYKKYAFTVGSIYLSMLIANIRDDYRNNQLLKKSLVPSYVRVFRDNKFISMSEAGVLPGDLIYIDTTENFSCDVKILRGDVITDESFLTGESVPICKGEGALIYSGTKIIKSALSSDTPIDIHMEKLVKVKNLTKNQETFTIDSQAKVDTLSDSAIGLVIGTGQKTKRNRLMTSLSLKKPCSNEFTKQSLVVIKYLTTAAFLLMLSFFIYFYNFLDIWTNLEYSSDVALTFFSPALYTCLQLGIQRARRQLLKKKINTTEVSRINTAGEVDMVIFDKTGTLTEKGVDILCLDNLSKSYKSVHELDLFTRVAISSCHYVVELDSQYSGDILDMKMFLFSQSKIFNCDGKRLIEMEVMNNYEPFCKEITEKNEEKTLFLNSDSGNNIDCPDNVLEIIKIYDFDSYLKRISVVVKNSQNQKFLICKGAPDSLQKIIKDLPSAFSKKVQKYGLEGYRVLAIAYKSIDENVDRETDEKDLTFLSLLVFANQLKKETTGVIKELKDAGIYPKMCTGDNILTAISVAKECGMVDKNLPVLFPVLEDSCKSCYDVDWYCVADEDYIFDKLKMTVISASDHETSYDFAIACESKEFEFLKGTCYEPLILNKGIIFARFNPENKKDLVETYSKMKYVTMFCGDGANDTSALATADVGLSLATNEASLAASFNSQYLVSVLNLIKEGRSALSMSSAQFNYIFYSQVLAGLQITVLFCFNLFPSDVMSLVNDLLSCYVLGYAISSFKCSSIISRQKFVPSLLKNAIFSTLELSIILVTFFCFKLTVSEPKVVDTVKSDSKFSTLLYFSTLFLLIQKAIKFSDFNGYREPRSKNFKFILYVLFCMSVFLLVISSFFLNFAPIVKFFNFNQLSELEKKYLVLCIVITTVLSNLPYKKLLD